MTHLFTFFVGLSLLPLAQVALAQTPPEQAREVRTTIALEGLPKTTRGSRKKPAVHPSLEISRLGEDAGSWRLSALPYRDGPVLSSIRILEWIGDEYYTYSTEVVPIAGQSDAYYVLFRAIPSEEGAPSGAPMASFVWAVEQEPGKLGRWRFVAKGTYSMLDGGVQLELRPKKGTKGAQLVRQRENVVQRFCGIVQEQLAQEEIFDPVKNLFGMTLDVEALLKGAVALRPTLFPAPGFVPEPVSGYAVWQSATSDLRTPSNATTILRPLELADNDPATVWAEGQAGVGRGEFVSATVESALPMKGIRIYPGRGTDKTAFENSPLPKQLLIGLSGGTRFVVDMPHPTYEEVDARGGVFIEFPSPVTTDCLSVMILDAYPPTGPAPERRAYEARRAYEDALGQREAVTISEVTPMTMLYGLEPQIAAEQLIKLAYAQDDVPKRQRLSLITTAYSPYLIEALRAKSNAPGGLKDLDRAATLLAALPSAQAIPLLIDLVDRVDPKTPAYRALRRALAAHYEEAAGPILDEIHALPGDATQKRIDLIRLYGRVAPQADLQALVEDLGVGQMTERLERIRAISAGKGAVINPLLDVLLEDSAPPEAKDDAAKTLAALSRFQIEKIPLDPTQRARWTTLLDTKHPTARAVQLIRASGRFEVAEEVLIQRYYKTQSNVLLRMTTAQAFAHFLTLRSRQLLEAALLDPSPDVRIEAIRALTKRSDREASSQAILEYASKERWPEGLEPALLALAAIDSPATNDAMAAWILDLSAPERALLSAKAFERRRRAPPHLPQIIAMLRDPQAYAPFPLKRQLLEVMAYDDSTQSEDLLVDVVARDLWKQTVTPRQHEALLTRAMLSLGHRRTPRAKFTLLAILTSPDATIEAQKLALRGLAFFVDEPLRKQLKSMRAAIKDQSLDQAYGQAIAIIGRRLDVDQIQRQAAEAEAR